MTTFADINIGDVLSCFMGKDCEIEIYDVISKDEYEITLMDVFGYEERCNLTDRLMKEIYDG
jgi:hypothetical protein